MQAVILAGGKGTRLRPLTIHTPKPEIPLVGRPFLFYQLDLLHRADIHEVVLGLSYQPNKIKDIFGDGSHFDMNIEYTVESQPLGTAGAYKNAEGVIDSPTVVFNGDILTDLDLNEVIRFHNERNALVTIVLTPVENPRAYGLVETEADGRVVRFREKPTSDDEITTNTINAGTYILNPAVLDEIPSGESYSFEYDLFPKLLARGAAVYGFVSKYYWIDIGTPQRYIQANLDLLGAGLPNSRFDHPARGEKVDERAEVDHLSWIDPSVTVKPGAKIVNSVVEANCVVEEKAVIERSVLRRSTRIGQSAVVRDSALGLGVHVGRNASLSRAILGDKSAVTDYSIVGESV